MLRTQALNPMQSKARWAVCQESNERGIAVVQVQ